MPINVKDPEYAKAEQAYHEAQTPEQKLLFLKKMITHAPKHKGTENLLKQFTQRRKKLEQEIVKAKKSGKGTKQGIKKDDMQAVIIGKTNSGKSTLLSKLTNNKVQASQFPFTTKVPEVGMMSYAGTSVQLIEIPAIDSEYYDRGIVNTADTIILLINSMDEIEKIKVELKSSYGNQIIVYNKIDLLNENEKRKLDATFKSKKYNFVLISAKTHEGFENLKEKIFESFNKIRVYTKEPGKEKSNRPIILNPNSRVKDVAEKILKGFSKKIRETKIWGPSSKFAGQKVGLTHKIKDLDIIEFKTH